MLDRLERDDRIEAIGIREVLRIALAIADPGARVVRDRVVDRVGRDVDPDRSVTPLARSAISRVP